MHVEAKRIPKEDSELPDLEITLFEGGNLKGEYLLTSYRPWNAWKNEKEGYHYADIIIRSYESGRHIPRILIAEAAAEIQKAADSAKSKIKHEAYFLTPDSEKIKPLYLERGYEFQGEGLAFRIFYPKTF